MSSMKVRATAAGFPPAIAMPHVSQLTFTDQDLAAALFVTGRAPGDEALHGQASVLEFIHRAALVPAYLRSVAGDRVSRSALALELDRSEKVNLSYSLGQAMAGVFAQQRLGVARLMHVDRYAAHFGVSFAAGRQRPDLIGVGTGGWVVIEAKGRSNAMEASLPAKLKSQAAMVASIGGAAPWVSLGSIAQFPPPARELEVHAIDPPSKADGLRWEIDRDRLVAAYYAPFVRAIDAGAEFDPVDDGGEFFEIGDLGSVGVRVGLLREVAGLVRERGDRSTEGLAEEIDAVLEERVHLESVRPDGSWFETSWDAAFKVRDLE